MLDGATEILRLRLELIYLVCLEFCLEGIDETLMQLDATVLFYSNTSSSVSLYISSLLYNVNVHPRNLQRVVKYAKINLMCIK